MHEVFLKILRLMVTFATYQNIRVKKEYITKVFILFYSII